MVAVVSACSPIHPIFPRQDGSPAVAVDPTIIKDAVPRQDLVTRAGNKNPYTVLGKTYHLLPAGESYIEQGVASWYGTKFHGRPTANGERYSLYGMTAAHKTILIPAYVKVTNLENNRSTIVRINDRGPFHDDRIIDLSYAAAVKLGYAEQGTTRVEVELITPSVQSASDADTQAMAKATDTGRFFLQVGAFKSLELANKMRAELLLLINRDVKIRPSEPAGFYRVQIGPLTELTQVQQISERLMALNMGQPQLIAEQD